MAFRLIYIARRPAGHSLETFGENWREHSNRASRLGNTTSASFRGVRQCIRVAGDEPPGQTDGRVAGVNFLTMRGWEGLVTSLGNPKPRDAATREREMAVFGCLIEPLTFIAESATIIDRRRGGSGLLHLIGRREGVGLEATISALADFRDRVFALPVVKAHAAGFVLNRTISAPKPDADFACVSELWFDDAARAAEAADDPDYREAVTSLCRSGDAAGSIAMRVRINHEKGVAAGLDQPAGG